MANRWTRAARVVIWPLVRPFLPAYDPGRRRRCRRLAGQLVTLEIWPGMEATSKEAAQMALLRVLDLQRQVRWATRLRQRDGPALLARTAIDACITGIFCLFVPDAVGRLNADNAQSFRSMLGYLKESGLITPETIAAAVSAIGEPRRLTSLNKLLEEVVEQGGPPEAKQLYERVYIPASSLFAHGSGLALLRHTGPGDRIRGTASTPWSRHSPAHTADACVGLLGALIAGGDDPRSKELIAYADWHWRRVAPIVLALGSKGVAAHLRPGNVQRAVAALREIITYLESDAFATSTVDERSEQIEPKLVAIFEAIDGDPDRYRGVVQAYVTALANLAACSANGPAT
jgi:hypothetical protein